MRYIGVDVGKNRCQACIMDEEAIKDLVEETFERSKITMMHLRPISTLLEEDQMTVINAMLDTFIEGDTVSKRRVSRSSFSLKGCKVNLRAVSSTISGFS